MIDFLRGKVVHIEEEYAVLDVHGVGYRVYCANPYALQARQSEEVTVFIHHHVREDAILLFGFASREEQSLFRKLLDVSGIGPRVALGILSGGRPETVIAAIQREDIVYLTKLPGIGKKTAQRIILDLKDKLSGLPMLHGEAAAAALSAESQGVGQTDGSVWHEAKEALAALGYTEAELDKAWSVLKSKISPQDTVDTVMKLALQALFKG